MPKPSFTPGPWNVATHFNGRVTIQTQGFRPIATVTMRKSDESDCHANARLIAAVPELLDGLKAAEELLAFHEGSANPATEGGQPVIWVNGEDWQNLLDSTRQLIARAEGGQP